MIEGRSTREVSASVSAIKTEFSNRLDQPQAISYLFRAVPDAQLGPPAPPYSERCGRARSYYGPRSQCEDSPRIHTTQFRLLRWRRFQPAMRPWPAFPTTSGPASLERRHISTHPESRLHRLSTAYRIPLDPADGNKPASKIQPLRPSPSLGSSLAGNRRHTMHPS
jgi:hypothetical protein